MAFASKPPTSTTRCAPPPPHFLNWAAAPPLRRARILIASASCSSATSRGWRRDHAPNTARSLSDAAGEMQRGIEVVEFASGIPQLLKGEFTEEVGTGVDSYSMRQPLGVVAGITPFNFPAMVPLWMFPVALACGNTFILKPSEKDPSMSIELALPAEGGRAARRRLQRRQRRQGSGRRDPRAPRHRGDQLRRARRRSPSTSTRSGTSTGKRVQALGGAKNHMVIMPDADLDQATDALVGAAYGSAGERCMAISVAVVVGDAAGATNSSRESRDGSRR